ncbi:MAG: tyrosine-type recombinase/integrase [Proteobacteria bacterium]|nr:tyrosine-type recombinase/integrase [Pseudomonadota bacterium]
MRTKLTDRNVNRKPPESGQIEMWDTTLPGFGIRIGHGGKRTYNVMVRINGKQRRVTVANAKLIGLAESREKAREIMRDAARGIDPVERERIDRREAQKTGQGTFAAIAEMYMQEKGRQRKSAGELQRKLDREILPEIGHLPIADITRADIKNLLLKKAATAPIAANRLLALIRPIFAYAQDEERLETVPNLRNLMQEETPRNRVLSDEEIKDVWRASQLVGYPYGHIVRLLLLTGQRRSEVAGLVMDELNGDGWKLPAERSKNGRGHLIPLAALAQEIIDHCRDRHSNGLVFRSTGSTRHGPLSGWGPMKTRLDKFIVEIRREDAEKTGEDPEKVKSLPHWTLHDLRRTAATGLQSLGFSDEVIDRVLNHALPGVRRAYNQFSRNPEKKMALDAWARHVESIVDGKAVPSNVVALAETRS